MSDAGKWDNLVCSRVGKLAAYGFSNAEIAEAMQLTVENVNEIRLMAPALQAQSDQMQAKQEQAMLVEDGWNAVEEISIAKVLETLRYNSDPSFALLAARTANQAKRSASGNRHVLDAGRAGTTVILNLGAAFVERVQAGQVTEPLVIENRARKISDVMAPSQVSKMLGVETQTDLEAELDILIGDALNIRG